MALQPKSQLAFDDWLAAERAATQGRSEYVDGEIFAMAGASETHNLIAGNIFATLHNCFKGRPCYVYTSDMKVRIESANLGFYPDAMAVCGERVFWDERKDVLANPALIVEVLSDSTEAYDRGDKFAHYRTIPSLAGLSAALPASDQRRALSAPAQWRLAAQHLRRHAGHDPADCARRRSAPRRDL